MSVSIQQLDRKTPADVSVTLRNAGIAGAGGAGFPSHAKWELLDEVDALLVNHQESEPNYYMDRWIGREHADELSTLFDALLSSSIDLVVVGAKETYREEWMGPLEDATDGRIYAPSDLPLDPDQESGVVFAYTEDRYEFGMESVLLRIVGDTVIGQDLPTDRGWVVQNTETLFNVYRSLSEGEPVTRKYVHVDGNVPEHRFLDVPIGTPASALLEAAGRSPGDLRADETLADGGPGWCFEIDASPDAFGVRKRTNCLLVLGEEEVEANTLGDDRINVLGPRDWGRESEETGPTTMETAEYVRVPLITNRNFEGVVQPGQPIVRPDDTVEAGDMIARPSGDISIAHHAPIAGDVTDVSETHIRIDRHEAVDANRGVYWTWCTECGQYVPEPEMPDGMDLRTYVCPVCR